MQNIKDVFIKCDTSKDGVLSYEEMKKGLQEVLGGLDTGSVNWKEMFDEIDTDKSGAIDYGEFVTAAVNKEKLVNEKNIDMVFKLYDKDGDGEITADEFKNVFRGAQSFNDGEGEDIWEQILEEVDENGDGTVSMAEFKKAMLVVLEKRGDKLDAKEDLE